MNAFTALHISIYRLSSGRIGGYFRGAPVLLLTTTGKKTGKPRTTPLLYLPDRDRWILVGSNGGRPNDPSWWSNLKKKPEAEIRIKSETTKVFARKASPDEKARLWPILTKMYRQYDDYQRKTARDIPVVVLDPVTATDQ